MITLEEAKVKYRGVKKIPSEHIKELKKQLRIIDPKSETIEGTAAIYDYIYGTKQPICECCGQPHPYLNFSKGYAKTCGNKKCKKYIANSNQKRVKTNLAKYGVAYISQTDKIANANLKKHGTKSVFATNTVKEKIKQTVLSKYGVENISQVKEIREKAVNTLVKNYGVDSPLKNKEIKEKAFRKIKEKYNVPSFLDNPDIRDKSYLKNKSTGYDNLLIKAKENKITPLFTKEEYISVVNPQNHIWKWKCEQCGNTFEHDYYSSRIPICKQCSPISKPQDELVEYIKSLGITNIQTNTRSIISPLELDIYIPKLKLAIEFNGDYWHSEDRLEKDYHLNKTKLCEEKGIKLIHIWEHQYQQSRTKVLSRLNNALGIFEKTIYARKCNVKEISAQQANKFLDQHHLQGINKAKVKLGLYYQDELIAVMTFGKPRFNKNYQWELLRFANKTGYHIPGAASKLLKYFEKEYKPNSLISYADLSWGKGNLYTCLGFTLKEHSSPNYAWIRRGIIYTRYQTQKHRLKNILKDKFDPNKSETENMKDAGFLKLYDCGNAVFVKEYTK